MGNCCPKLQSIKLGRWRPSDYRQIAILLVGLDNAGKTSVTNGISGNLTNTVLPTVGFSSISIKFKGHSVTLYDVGGGPQIRNIWSQYYGNVHGFIFVIDASDVHRLHECKEVFSNMIWHEKVFGKPILICLNKQDKEGTMHEFDITEQMDVEKLVNLRQCPTKVEICSALPLQQINRCRHIFMADPSLISGFRWLVSYILLNYENLNNRVMADEKKQVEAAELRRKEWKRQKKVGTDKSDESPTETKFKNPFKPISNFLRESDDHKVANNGSIRKTTLSPKNSRLKNVDVIIERNSSLPPVDVINPRNSVQKLDQHFIKPGDKNSHPRSINTEDDDDDVNIFYAKALQQNNDQEKSSPDLSVFTISGRNIKPEQIVETNLDERIHSSSEEFNDHQKNSGKIFFPFRRNNKTAPAPINNSFHQKNPELEVAFKIQDINYENSKSSSPIEYQSEPVPTSNNFLVGINVSNAQGLADGTQKVWGKSKRIFTRNKPITSSTECILTDSDSADVVV